MKKLFHPSHSEWNELTLRVQREDTLIEGRVEGIIGRVIKDRDAALRELSLEIEGRSLTDIKVSEGEFLEAEKCIDAALKDAIATAAANIRRFHSSQSFKMLEVEVMPGVKCFQKAVPISRVGLYIPGGSAPLFSTVLMLSIPAKIAGCPSIILCTPASADGKVSPAVLYTARYCGIDRVFKIGGAQAIAAMAYGTETVTKVDKIFGPGNRYVTKAKEKVSSIVSIDMPAGPSEVLVMADRTGNPVYIAADLLSQAEHGPDSQVILVTDDSTLADSVEAEVGRQLDMLPRNTIASKALEESRLIVLRDREEMLAFSNLYAPEHLIIQTENPWQLADRVTAAGSVFVGAYSPESAGDYASGTNHTLPTSFWSRSYSGVNLDSFIRKITYQELTKEGLSSLGSTIVNMAAAEGLDAHANAVKVRLK